MKIRSDHGPIKHKLDFTLSTIDIHEGTNTWNVWGFVSIFFIAFHLLNFLFIHYF